MADHNIPRSEHVAPPHRAATNFPGLRWHPQTGEHRAFDKAEDVPEGWLDHHPASADAHKAPAPNAADLPLTRDEIKAALKAGDIKFASNAATSALYETLLVSVKKALADENIAHDANSTDAKALLELFPKA